MTYVFISYSSKDVELAKEIQQRLEAANFRVWRDERSIEKDWSHEIAHALAEKVDVVCMIWTYNANKSHWVNNEWLSARALSKLIIPCIFPAAPDLPKPLLNVKGIKFEDMSDGCGSLIEHLSKLTSFSTDYDYSILPSNSYIPFNPNPGFIGRLPELVELFLKMIGNLNKMGVNQVGLSGMAGIGKTQLAIEFASRFSFAFPNGIYWIQAADPKQWSKQFVGIAKDYLQLKTSGQNEKDQDKQYFVALQRYFKEHPQTLIVMDNVEDPRNLNNPKLLFSDEVNTDLTPLTLGSNVLFTTRKKFNIAGVSSYDIDILSPEYSYDLLTLGRKPVNISEENCARTICGIVGYLPLALVLVGGYLEKYRSISFLDYEKELIKNQLGAIDLSKMSREQLATRHEAAVKTTLRSHWIMLKDKNAQKLLRLICLFEQSELITKARLALFSAIPLERESKLDRPLDSSILLLEELNLLNVVENERSVILHPLLRSFVQNLMSNDESIAFKSAAASNLKDAYDDPSCLETEFLSRGIDQIVDDIIIGISWADRTSSISGPLISLCKLLDHERHHLRTKQKEVNTSQFFFQQLYFRAQMEDSKKISESYLKEGKLRAGIMFKVLKPPQKQDDAVIRRFKFPEDNQSFESPRILVKGSNESRVLCAGWHKLTLWNTENGSIIRTFEGHSSYIMDIRLCNDDTRAISIDNDNLLILWDLKSGKIIDKFFLKHGSILNVDPKSKPSAVSIGSGCRSVLIAYDNRDKVEYDKPKKLMKTILVLWDLEHKHVIRNIEYTGHVNAVYLSQDNRQAVSGDALDGTIVLWDLRTGQATHTFTADTNPEYKVNSISKIILTSDGKQIISSANEIIAVWDIKKTKLLRVLRGHNDTVLDFSLSPDGRYILSTSADNTMILWDIESGNIIRTFRGHYSMVYTATFSLDGLTILSGSSDGTIILWKFMDVRIPDKVNVGHTGRVDELDLSGDGNYALSTSDKEIILWNARSGQAVQEITLPLEVADDIQVDDQGLFTSNGAILMGPPIMSLSLDKKGQSAAVALKNGVIILLDMYNQRVLRKLEGHEGPVSAVKLSSDGKHILSSSYDHRLILWSGQGKKIRMFSNLSEQIYTSDLSFNNNFAVCGTFDGKVVRWDINNGNILDNLDLRNKLEMLPLSYNRNFGDSVSFARLSGDGTKATVIFRGSNLLVIDFSQGCDLLYLRGHVDDISSVCISLDGKMALSSSFDGELILWDIVNGFPLNRMIIDGGISSLAMMDDRFVVGNELGQVIFMEIIGPVTKSAISK